MLPLLLLAFLCAPQPAPSQEGGDVHPPAPVEVLRKQEAGGQEDEMKVLFENVEQRLREIDRMLYDASAGRRLEASAESGIEELLKRTRKNNEEVLAGIDRILDLAQERKQQQSQGSGQQQQEQPGQQGKSPLDQQQPGDPSQREATPEGPGEGDRPQPGDEQPAPGEQEKQGQRPEGKRDSESEPNQGAGSNPPVDATGSGAAGDGDGRWGDLPVHVRELFRAQGSTDMPPHYRDWIDAYYRRLNRVP